MKTMDVEVVDVRKITGDGKLKAMADVKLGGSVVIKGFCVFQGKNGVFVSMPRRVSKDGRWMDTMEPVEDLRAEIEDRVLKAYGRETDGVED